MVLEIIEIVMTDPSKSLGYWHQRADERHGNPPQGNQELLVTVPAPALN